MKNLIYILVIIFFWSCTEIKPNVQIRATNNNVIITNATVKDAAIFLWNEETQHKAPIKGEFLFQNDTLTFIPEFPLVENTEYVFVNANKYETRFSLPKKERKPLTITAVYPTTNKLPENLLRMYIQFSNPMKTTGNLENIKLINEEGEEIKGAVFNNVYELWDDDQTQLTIIFTLHV